MGKVDMSEDLKFLNDDELQKLINAMNRKINIVWGIFGISAVLVIGGILIMQITGVDSGAVFLFAGAIMMLITSILIAVFCKKRRITFSEQLTKSVLGEVFELKEYKPLGHIETNLIKETQLIGASWNTINGSDFFRGVYRGVEVTCSDLHLELIVSTGKTTSVIEVFKGQWITLKTKKRLGSKLVVREKDEKIFGGHVKAKSDIETESSAFNEKYQIKTDNPHDAFYILTPHFMEFLDRTDDIAGAKSGFCFEGNEIHYACGNGKDLFEVKRKTAPIPELRKRMKGEVEYITELVDELLNNEKLFEVTEG